VTRGRAKRSSGADPSTRVADVVVAIVRDGSKVLVQRRPKDAHLGDHDEFPGGRRDPRETLEEACAREVKEEVGLDVKVERLLSAGWYQGGGRKLALSFYECRCVGSTEPSKEAVEQRQTRWVEAAELAKLHFPPANAEVVKRLVADANGASAKKA
jgi:mutator protein MutT